MSRIEENRKQKVPSASQSPTGQINPSAPASGTEGYGMQDGEYSNDEGGRSASHPATKGPGDVRKTSYPAPEESQLMENQGREDALRENPNARQGKQFRCADVGNTSCNWSVIAQSDDEIMNRAEQHGREAHGMKDIDEDTRQKIRGAIRDKAA